MVRDVVRDFRLEYRKDAARLKELLDARNPEIISAISAIQERLIAATSYAFKIFRWASTRSSSAEEKCSWCPASREPAVGGVTTPPSNERCVASGEVLTAPADGRVLATSGVSKVKYPLPNKAAPAEYRGNRQPGASG